MLHAGDACIETVLPHKVLLDKWNGDVFVTNVRRGIDIVKVDDMQTLLASHVLIKL